MLKTRLVLVYFTIISSTLNFPEVKCLLGKDVHDAHQDDSRSIVYMGSLGKLNALNFHRTTCTGVFITTEHILALADCIEKVRGGRFRISGGSNNLHRAVAYEVSEFMTYNDWAILHDKPLLEGYQDIAIVTIANPGADPLMRPVHLPNFNHEFYGADVTVMGLGSTDTEKFPGTLKSATLKLLSKRDCESRVPSKFLDDVKDGRIICSNPSPQLVNKDRGGPVLYSKNTLVGLNLVPRQTHLWIKIPPINVHLKIHSHTMYKDFICDLAGHQLNAEESQRPSNIRKSFCPESNEVY